MAAYLLLIRKVWRPVLAGILTPVRNSESSYLEISRATMSNTTHPGEATIAVDGVLQPLDVRPGQTIRIDNFTFVVSPKESYPILSNFVYGRDSVLWCHRDRRLVGTTRLEERDLTRWRLAARAMAYFPDYRTASSAMYVTWRGGLQHSVSFHSTATLWPCIPSIIAVFYGSCHLLGWNSTFPTSGEHTTWQAGASAMVILGLFASVLQQVIVHEYQPVVLDLFVKLFGMIIYLISLAAYPVISSFLVVESLRQLFYLPDDAFRLPDFSVYFPHFA